MKNTENSNKTANISSLSKNNSLSKMLTAMDQKQHKNHKKVIF